MLIAFAGYLQSAQFDPGSVAHTRFPDWMVARAELRRWVQGLMGGGEWGAGGCRGGERQVGAGFECRWVSHGDQDLVVSQ